MPFTRKPIVIALMSLPLAALAADDTDYQQRIEALEKEIQDMKTDMKNTRSMTEDSQQKVDANNAALEDVRVAKKGTKLTYGGYIKLDAMYSNYSEGKPGNQRLIEEFMVPSLIPVENADPNVSNDSFQSLNMHAKESRFFFGTSTETDVGNISSYIEMDFILSSQGDERISNSQATRLRHAFLKWQYSERNSLLAGQTWTTFFNAQALPDLLDFVGPVGTIFNRQAQIRWSTGGFQLGIENPYTRLNGWVCDDPSETECSSSGDVTAEDVQSDSETIPDVVLRYDGTAGSLSWAAIAIGRQLAYDERADDGSTEVSDDTAFGYGLNFSGVVMFGRNDLRFSLLYGDALGRYFAVNGFNDGYIENDGSIGTFAQYGGFIAYRQFWSDRWRSTFSLSTALADNPDQDKTPVSTAGWAKAYNSFHANLIWMPYTTLQIGGELIYATKEVEDGRDGSLSRFQLSFKYAF